MADDRVAFIAHGRLHNISADLNSQILYCRMQKVLDRWTFTYETAQFIKEIFFFFGKCLVKRADDI